jgi:alkylresorcinol/alkylpyrone synthase
MSIILSSKTSFPKYRYSQKEMSNFLGEIFPEKQNVIEKIFANSLVGNRNLAMPLANYKELSGLKARNDVWQKNALELQRNNLNYFFYDLKFPISDIAMIISTTITGLSIPSLEAKLMNEYPFSLNTKRVPIFGLGCLGGVACIARADDYLRQHTNEAVLILATELCSLTFQLDDLSMANIVGCSLFADGAGAILMVGDHHPWAKKGKFKVQGKESIFFPNSERMMGWDIIDNGFKLVLSGDVPKIISEQLVPGLNKFLEKKKISQADLGFYLSHSGGPKVLMAMEESLNLPKDSLHLSYESLAHHGNMSSVSVINVLENAMKNDLSKKYQNQLGVMVAMGPAFCAELVLLKGL